MRKIVTFLWFHDGIQEAVDRYVSLFDGARILTTSYLTEAVAQMSGKKTGDVSSIDFELAGQQFTALNGGPMYTLTEAASIAVNCATQAEIDRLWDSLTEGGEVLSCGWLKDRWGLTWQIMPESLDVMLRDPDPVKANRVGEAMLAMPGKLDLHELERAYRGET